MLKTAFLISSIATLSACGPVADIETFAECVDAIEERFPGAKGLSGEDFPGEVLGVGETDADGAFALGVNHEDGTSYWFCSGNSETRIFEELTFKGATIRPAPSEDWSY